MTDYLDKGNGELKEVKTAISENEDREPQRVLHPNHSECYGCKHNGDGHCRFECKM